MTAGRRQGPQIPLAPGSRTLPTVILALGILAIVLLAGPAAAQEGDDAGRRPFVNVVEVSGYLDPILVDFLTGAVDDSADEGAEALVVQLNSPGALVSQADLDALTFRMSHAGVPVAVWVGPSGSRALGGAASVVLAADVAGMAPGSRLGDAPPGVFAELPDEVRDGKVGPERALELGLVDLNQEEAAILGTFIASLDGREVRGHTLETADFEEQDDGPPVATLTVQTRLAKVPLGARLLHTVASPPVAYLLLTAALALLVFEFFTAGIGVAGGVGAVAGLLAAYGLTVLPTSPVGLALLVVGTFGFAIDVQTGVPRLWTAVGVVAYATGSLLLFDEGVRLGWIPLAAGVIGMVLLMLAGLPATVRSRFSTPTIGREALIGELGEAVADVGPDGVVRIREALWPAHTNRATPIGVGDPVRVVGIDGPRLEVEPEAGGARDYREGRSH